MAAPPANDRRFALRYTLVAGFCALLHNVIVIGATLAGTGVVGAAILSFCLMVVAGYLLMCAIAFRTEPTKAGFARYTAAMAGNFPVATGLLWLCVVPLRLPVIFVSPIVTLVMFGINFIMSRWAIAKPKAPCGY